MTTSTTIAQTAGQPATRIAPSPVPLDEYPEVVQLLTISGLGDLQSDGLISPLGRNTSWLGTTTNGHQIFVKKMMGPELGVQSRMRRMASCANHMLITAPPEFSVPATLAQDESLGVIVHQRITNGTSLAEQVIEGWPSPRTCKAVGAALAGLHESEVIDELDYDLTPPDLPFLPDLDHLPLSRFQEASWGEIQALRLQQQDGALHEALKALRLQEQEADKVPSHCDLRLDQIIVLEGDVWILDWEEFRLADPARDLGGLLGELLHRALLGIARPMDGQEWTEAALSHEDVLIRGTQRLVEIRPLIESMWSGYAERCSQETPQLIRRAVAFAGWHLQDRLLAGAQNRSNLTGIDRACAGIGRGLLLYPERFAASLGLGEAA